MSALETFHCTIDDSLRLPGSRLSVKPNIIVLYKVAAISRSYGIPSILVVFASTQPATPLSSISRDLIQMTVSMIDVIGLSRFYFSISFSK